MKPNEENIIQNIKSATDSQGIFDVVSDLSFLPISSRMTFAIAKRLEQTQDNALERVALLSNFTLDMLVPHIITSLAMLRTTGECYVAPYNQYFQDVLNEGSELHQFNPTILLLNLTMRELLPDLFYRFAEMKHEQRWQQANEAIEHVIKWVNLTKQQFSANILVANYILPPNAQLGIADHNEPETEIEFYQKLNEKLRYELKHIEQAHLLDVATLASKVGWQRIYDPKFYYTAKMFWSEEFMQAVGQEIARYSIAWRGLAKKCLVLDLDNTLWGGVLGEEGVTGIKVGKGDPVSEAYRDFQYKIKSLKQRGIVLAICSKNNLEDVEEAFAVRNDMPLSLTDFATIRINWEMKHQNIQEIAEELNIGTDSLVFIDDDPAEISLIRQMIPETLSILLPEAHEEIPALLDRLPYFEKLHVLDTDKEKTQQYIQNKKRVNLESSTTNLEDYLKSLSTQVELKPVCTEDIPRIHQLFTKTNQFNLTTIRYSLSDIQRDLANENCDLWCYSVNDNFGDLGDVGLLLIKRCSHEAYIDSFIMSCRAMGRGIEFAIINWLKSHYLLTLNLDQITAKYLPTKKNKPVKNLYTDNGFITLKESDDEILYGLKSNSMQLKNCEWINLISKV